MVGTDAMHFANYIVLGIEAARSVLVLDLQD
jgi:hypothetical protein